MSINKQNAWVHHCNIMDLCVVLKMGSSLLQGAKRKVKATLSTGEEESGDSRKATQGEKSAGCFTHSTSCSSAHLHQKTQAQDQNVPGCDGFRCSHYFHNLHFFSTELFFFFWGRILERGSYLLHLFTSQLLSPCLALPGAKWCLH